MSLNLTSGTADDTVSSAAGGDRPMFEIDDRYRRIGGWLILFCVNLVLTPAVALLAVVGLFTMPDEIALIPGVTNLLRIGVVQLCVLGHFAWWLP